MRIDGPTAQAVARAQGIELDLAAATAAAIGATAVLTSFQRLAATLAADDDPALFRRLLEREAAR